MPTRGPAVKQRQIATTLGINPQAVSDYIARLLKDGCLGRRTLRLPFERRSGELVIKTLREMDDYNTYTQRAITSIATCTAIAANDIKKGAEVSLVMKDGLLYATTAAKGAASGIAATSADTGTDIGITGIRGIVDLEVGTVEIFEVPSVENGGSRDTDYEALRTLAARHTPVFSLGLEAWAVCVRWGGRFQHFGAADAAIEAARSGMNPLVVCAEGESAGLVKRLADADIGYRIKQGKKSS